jgi:polyhydroxyalkanoate synthesis regulator phasin
VFALGNGVCDEACNNFKCGNDHGDCKPDDDDEKDDLDDCDDDHIERLKLKKKTVESMIEDIDDIFETLGDVEELISENVAANLFNVSQALDTFEDLTKGKKKFAYDIEEIEEDIDEVALDLFLLNKKIFKELADDVDDLDDSAHDLQDKLFKPRWRKRGEYEHRNFLGIH